VRLVLTFLVACGVSSAQTTVYLHTGSPFITQVISPGCTNTTPVVCTLTTTVGLTVGDTVSISAVSSVSTYGTSSANGLRKISAINGNTITITDMDGNPIAGNGAWTDGSTPGTTGPFWAYVAKVVPFTLNDPPLAYWDGANGGITRRWATGPANGLVSLICDGSKCTVTTSYSQTVSAGDKVTVWNSGNTTLTPCTGIGGGCTAEYTVLASPAPTDTTYAFTSAAPAANYVGNNMHCGPGASPNGTIQGTEDCLRVSLGAVSTSPWWTRAQFYLNSQISPSVHKWLLDGGTINGTTFLAGYALGFVVDQANQNFLNPILYQINNLQYVAGVNFTVNELQPDGGNYPLSAYGNVDTSGLVEEMTVGLPYLPPDQRTAALAKVMNDVGDPGGCVKNTPFPQGLANGSPTPQGYAQGGDSTHITLQADDTAASGAYVGWVIWAVPLGSLSQGTITAYDSTTKIATIGAGWKNAAGSTGVSPTARTYYYFSQVAQGGSATTIQLAASEAVADNFYVGNIIITMVSQQYTYGTVTGYTASTQTATVASWSGGRSPSAGTPYTISQTITRSGTTITGINTHFATSGGSWQINVDDGIWAETISQFATADPQAGQSRVTAVNSDTSLTVINGSGVTANGTPQVFLKIPKWQTGSCGLKWLMEYWNGAVGISPASHPYRGGDLSKLSWDGLPIYGGNNGYTFENSMINMALVLAPYDSRAVTWAASVESGELDSLVYMLAAQTGLNSSGGNYGTLVTSPYTAKWAWTLQHSVSGFPSLDTSGPWQTGVSLWKIYGAHPDAPVSTVAGSTERHRFPAYYGQTNTAVFITAPQSNNGPAAWATDAGMYFNPTAQSSKYLKDWLAVMGFVTGQFIFSGSLDELSVKLDPRIPRQDYTAQPLQHLFQATSYAAAVALGWPHPATTRHDAFISRTGWSNVTDSYVFFRASTFVGDHDDPQPGHLEFYKEGALLQNDQPGTMYPGDNPNNYAAGTDTVDILTGVGTLRGGPTGPAVSTIDAWSSANHGTWDTAYGDQNSNYACAHMDATGAYTTSMNRVWRWICHLKRPGTGEVLAEFRDLSSPSAIQMDSFVHYAQNGEVLPYSAFYPEGTTVCPGAGGCGSLNVNRTVLESEDGLSSNGDPPRQYNLFTSYFSPGTITLNFDGSSYTGAQGHTSRVRICAGGSCGGTATSLEAVLVHEVLTQPANTGSATALNPDANWTGAQTADKVVLFARGGAKRSSIASFTTSFSSSTADHLIAGLAAGVYNVTVNGSAVTGSPFTVANGDNTLFFNAPDGTVGISSGEQAISITTASPLPSGITGTPYNTTLAVSGGTGPYTWSVSDGSLCNGLSLNSGTGAVSGTPTTAQTCSFTITVTDSLNNTGNAAFGQTVIGTFTAVPVIGVGVKLPR